MQTDPWTYERSKVRHLSVSRPADKDLVAWWYSGVISNRRENAVPKTRVYFRLRQANGAFGNFYTHEVNLDALGLVRLGSVWRNGVSSTATALPVREFNLCLDSDGWRFVCAHEIAAMNGGKSASAGYALPDNVEHRRELIEFRLADGKRLLIHTLEFFARCYAKSIEVNRVLCTYGWDDVVDRLYRPLEQDVPPGAWGVNLADIAYNTDEVFLAHVWNDAATQAVVRGLYEQLQAQAAAANKTLGVAPWFRGNASMRVSFLQLDEQTYLGLRVDGMSHPGGCDVYSTRSNDGTKTSSDRAQLPATAYSGAVGRQLAPIPEILNFTDGEIPSQFTGSVEILLDDFAVLGEERKVVRMRGGESKTRAGPRSEVESPTTAASGEREKESNGIGRASIHAPIVMESQGVVRDMWNALLYLKQRHPDVIESVRWYTPTKGLVDSAEPQLVAFPLIAEADSAGVSGSVRNWPLLAQSQVRGMLVVQVKTSSREVYVVEIQRRRRMKQDAGLQEESFSGLVVAPTEPHVLSEWVGTLLRGLPLKEGIFSSLMGCCPNTAMTFAHKKAEDEEVPAESAARNALRKVGISLSKSKKDSVRPAA